MFQRLHRGVHCDGGVEPSPLMRGWAALLARGGHGKAWAAGRTLARMLELPLIDDDDPATRAYDRVHDDVAVLDAHPGRSGTLHVSRPSFGIGTDTVLVGGCPSLTLERALPGLAGVLTLEALVCLLDAALHHEQLTPERLGDAVHRERGGRQGGTLRRAAARATERVTWWELRTRQDATLRRVVEAAEQHARGR